MLLRKLVLIPLLALLYGSAFSQSSPPPPINLALLNDSLIISSQSTFYIDSSNNIKTGDILNKNFLPLSFLPVKRPGNLDLYTKPIYLQFSLYNSKDQEDSIHIFPGFLFNTIEVYKKGIHGDLERITPADAATGYPTIKLTPASMNVYFLKLSWCKTVFVKLNPQLIKDNYLPIYQKVNYKQYEDLNTVGFLLSGVLLMMMFFTSANYVLSRKREFLYYSLYSGCIFALFFLYALLYNKTNAFNRFFLEYLNFFLLITGNIFYIAFIRRFLDTKSSYKVLDRLFRTEEWILFISLIIYTILHYFTSLFSIETLLVNIMKFILLAMGVVYIIIAVNQKKRLLNYLAVGNALLLLFSCISLGLIWANVRTSSVITNSLFYYDIGVVLSLIFFLLGLTYKNREELIERIKVQESMKLDARKKEFESQLAILKAQQEERNRISADMHDDLGAGMTTIRLYSELARNKIKHLDIPEIEKISSSANELLNKMNAIIWSMSSTNDTLGNMVAYIRSYAQEYLENSGIDCIIELPDDIPNIEVQGEVRRNVFLVVKEALNNVIKHAGATKVFIVFTIKDNTAILTIKDNGKGIDFDKLREFGNGLRNMKKRMEDVGIVFSIEKRDGTIITLIRNIP